MQKPRYRKTIRHFSPILQERIQKFKIFLPSAKNRRHKDIVEYKHIREILIAVKKTNILVYLLQLLNQHYHLFHFFLLENLNHRAVF